MVGHSLGQGLYVVAGRPCPHAPPLYRQPAVCAADGVSCRSKIDLMAEQIRTFKPLPGTRTQVLLDRWYAAKRRGKVACERGFLLTTGRKRNRALRVADRRRRAAGAGSPCGTTRRG